MNKLLILALITTLSTTLAADPQPRLAPLAVSPETSEIAALSGAAVWRFRVTIPPHVASFGAVLELVRGDTVTPLARLQHGVHPDKREQESTHDIGISISPLNASGGEDFSSARHLIFRTSWRGTESCANPFRGCGAIIHDTPDKVDEAAYRLFSSNEAELRIRITPEYKPK